MSDIESNKWNDKKQDIPLHPGLIEKPLIGGDDRYAGFDDLHPPHKKFAGCRGALLWIIASAILTVFFIISFLYWLRWS